MTRRLRRALGAAAALTLLTPAGASAGGWLPADTVATPSAFLAGGSTQVAVGAGGAVAFVRPNVPAAGYLISVKPAGGTFASEEPLPIPGMTPPPRIAVGPTGDVVAVWTDFITGPAWSARSAEGTWSAPRSLGSTHAGALDVAFRPDGSAVAIWSADAKVRSAVRPAGGTFGPSALVAAETRGFAAALAGGPGGRMAVTWTDSAASGSQFVSRLRVAELPPGASEFGAAQSAVTSSPSSSPAPAYSGANASYGPDGTLHVAYLRAGSVTTADCPDPSMPWLCFGASSATNEVRTAVRGPGDGPWSDSRVDEATSSASWPVPAMPPLGPPSLAVTEDGSATALYPYYGGTPGAAEVRRARRPAGALGMTVASPLATDLSFPYPPAVAAVPGNRLVTALPSGNVLRGVTISSGGAIAADAPIATEAGPPTPLGFASTPSGVAATAWGVAEGAGSRVRVAIYDGQAPEMTDLSVPERATVGEPVAVGASARDALSAVRSTTWEFGDGKSAACGSASTVYERAGTYTVRATATDALGNVASRTQTIEVIAPTAATTPIGAGTPQPTAVDRRAPTIDQLKLSRKRFSLAKGTTALSAAKPRRTPKGTQLSWRLDEAARVTVAVERPRKGWRSGSRCSLKKPKVRKGRVRRCATVEVRGTLRRSSPAGVTKLAFTGRIGRKALPAGVYRFAVVATDAAGNVSKPERIAFTVARR